jgi:MFS superfamily sulfate permease-like transporter
MWGEVRVSDSAPKQELVDTSYLASLRHDVPASVVVFLIALPLCLGIAVASGAPPLAGLISGVIGGVVVAWASGSATAVSGPAAGLIAIVLPAIATLGYDGFLLAVVICGGIQVVLGMLRAGRLTFHSMLPSARFMAISSVFATMTTLFSCTQPK